MAKKVSYSTRMMMYYPGYQSCGSESLPSPQFSHRQNPEQNPTIPYPTYCQCTHCCSPGYDSYHTNTPSSEMSSSPSTPRSRYHPQSPQPPHPLTVPSQFAYRLSGRCRYMQLPAFLFDEGPCPSAMAPGPLGLVRVFFGQATYYCTPRILRWVVQAVCGVHVKFVEVMKPAREEGGYQGLPKSFFYLYVRSVEERDRIILTMHKRVLFDACGIWVAEDMEQAKEIASFVANERKTYCPSVPLPKGSVVVEADKKAVRW